MTIEIRELIIEARVASQAEEPHFSSLAGALTPEDEARISKRIVQQVVRDVMSRLRDEIRGSR